MQNQNEVKLTAAQKIDGIVGSMGVFDQALGNLSRQFEVLREAMIALNDKVDAMMIALQTNQSLSNDTINSIVESKKIQSLKDKVQDLINNNQITPSEEVTKNSFLVVREINDQTGEVVNARLQFISAVLNDESLSKVLGKKKGDSVKFVENDPRSVEIEEIYEIVTEQAKVEEAKEETQQEQTAQAETTNS